MVASPSTLDLDPFSKEFLSAPFSHHHLLRDAGAVVRLSRYGIWAFARYQEVSAALQDWQVFSSARGGGLADFAKAKPWRPPSIILEADPPSHTRTRSVLAKVLSRPALEGLRVRMEEGAHQLLDELLGLAETDGFEEIAKAFPLRVFPDAVGICREGRDNLLPYGDLAFNAFGPQNELLQMSLRRANEVSTWIMAQCQRCNLTADGFGAAVYAEADAGVITEAEAALLVRSLLTAGLDTTIQTMAHALRCFATCPEQWQKLRATPRLVHSAFHEVIRYASPVQTFFRSTTKSVTVADVEIPEGEKVLLFLAAANRDPRRWQDPDVFEITRDAAGHVGFGYGIHQCVGQMVARLEFECLFGALAARTRELSLSDTPGYWLNNTLFGLARLPLTAHVEPKQTLLPKDSELLQVTVAQIKDEAEGVISLELIPPDGHRLAPFEPGAHLDVHLPGGVVRQYSLCNDSTENHRYVIAVLREKNSRGGSRAIHEQIKAGDTLTVSRPRNHFPLLSRNARAMLLAAGIGITPILSMATALNREGALFELHYCAKSARRAAFAGILETASFADRVHLHFSDRQRLDLVKLLGSREPSDLYVCGPQLFIEGVLAIAKQCGWSENLLHREYFAAEVVHLDSDRSFEVELLRSQRTILVGKHETIVEALGRYKLHVPVSCEQGVCGTCITRVVAGIPDHRDSYLTEAERSANDQCTLCVSRSKTARLVLDA